MGKRKKINNDIMEIYLGDAAADVSKKEKRQLASFAEECCAEDEELRDMLPGIDDADEEQLEDDDEDDNEEEDDTLSPARGSQGPRARKAATDADASAADAGASDTSRQLSLLPEPLSEVNLPFLTLAHHHHIVHFVDVDPHYCPARAQTNILSNSCTDSSHQYHTNRHQHHLHSCKLHLPMSERESVYWNPYVRMRSSTVGTFSNFTFYDKLYYVEMSHHFIHVHDVFCKDLCLDPQGDPHMCPKHPQGDHGCPLLHIKARPIDKEGFSRASVVVETSTRTASQCLRWGSTDFAHFRHSHFHSHTLLITLHRGNPSEDPHDPYHNSITPVDSSLGWPSSPFST